MEGSPNAWFPVFDVSELPSDPSHLTLIQNLQTEHTFKVGLMVQHLHHPQHLVTASHTPV
jgi:hypothetical protein